MATTVASAAAPSEPPQEDAALVLAKGSVARRELVAIGRDLVVEGRAESDVAVVRGNLRVSGRVDGDVIALGGSILLGPEARVGGDAQALGGRVELEPGAEVAGRIAAYPRLHSSLLALVDGPVRGVGWANPSLLLVKVGLTAAWMLWAALCVVFAPGPLRRTAAAFDGGPLTLFASGLGVVLTSLLLIVLLTAVLPPPAAAPLVLLIAVLLLGLKLWGIAALSLVPGRVLARRSPLAMPPILGPALLGMTALNLLRFVPILGFVAWAAFTLVAVGAAVASGQWGSSRWPVASGQ